MQPKEKSKIIEVEDKKYRLSKLNARDASYLAFRLVGVLAPAAGAGGGSVDALRTAVANVDRAEFDRIQTLLLKSVCAIKEVNDIPMPTPVLKANGDFVDEELAYDPSTVMRITIEALMFNIGSFFPEAESTLKKNLQGNPAT